MRGVLTSSRSPCERSLRHVFEQRFELLNVIVGFASTPSRIPPPARRCHRPLPGAREFLYRRVGQLVHLSPRLHLRQPAPQQLVLRLPIPNRESRSLFLSPTIAARTAPTVPPIAPPMPRPSAACDLACTANSLFFVASDIKTLMSSRE